jgi:hypothetical protein
MEDGDHRLESRSLMGPKPRRLEASDGFGIRHSQVKCSRTHLSQYGRASSHLTRLLMHVEQPKYLESEKEQALQRTSSKVVTIARSLATLYTGATHSIYRTAITAILAHGGILRSVS